jgi:hypothetical protein
MTSYNQRAAPFVLNNYILVQGAAEYSGYSLQYLRCLLRKSELEGTKIGQLWLVDTGALDGCIKQEQDSTDQQVMIPLLQHFPHLLMT